MKSHNPDYILLGTVIILVIFGMAILSSASMVKSQESFDQPYFYLYHQLIYGLLVGIVAAFLAYKINYKFWKKYAFLIYLATVIGLLLVFLPNLGLRSGGAARWIALGSMSVQPSEIAKLGLIIYLAAWLENKSLSLNKFSEGFIPFLVATGLVAGLIVLQPNLGTAGLIGIIAVLMYFAAGARFSYLTFAIIVGLIALLFLIKIFPHAITRFQVFLHPELDPKGIGYQINQALLAIGSGGIFGRGLGQSIQKYNYLPEPIGDSIFAILAEELGFIGSFVLIALFVLLALRGLKIAKNAPDNFAKLLSIGIISWLIIQAFINLSAISGLIPLTGVPLPFVSYGGTAMIVCLVGIGILLNISKYTNPKS